MRNNKRHSSFFDMQFITSSISTMLVLLLLGLVVFFMLSANNLSTFVRENINFSLIVSDDMRDAELKKYQQQLSKEAFVKEAVYISKEDALKEQKEAMGTNPEEFLGYNPFHASIEIKLNSEYANSDSIAKIEKRLLKNKNILEVRYPQELMDAVNNNIRKISLFLLLLAALLTFISFALINNTIRLAVYSKRFLIHTMKLVGASWGFIRRPFLKKNFWIGVTAGIMADLLLMIGAYSLIIYEPELRSIITPEVMLIVLASVFLFGIIITLICANISINRYLKMKASALYYI